MGRVRQPRILVADDDPTFREILSVALDLEGHYTEDCGTADAPHCGLEKKCWDLVVLDTAGRGLTRLPRYSRMLFGSPERPRSS